MPEVHALRAYRLVDAQYDEPTDEVQLLFTARNSDQIGLTFPRSIGPLICEAIITNAAKAPDSKKHGEQDYQAIRYDGLMLGFGPNGEAIISFVAKDGGRLNMTTTPTTAADLRNLAKGLDDLSKRPEKLS